VHCQMDRTVAVQTGHSISALILAFSTHCRGEPFVDEPSKHLGLEPMGDHEPITGSTERIAGKHF